MSTLRLGTLVVFALALWQSPLPPGDRASAQTAGAPAAPAASRAPAAPAAPGTAIAQPAPGAARGGPTVEIKWDTSGVPHIAASSEEALFYAFGWAQMSNHANLILRLYGRARGRGAEYFGPNLLEADILTRALDIPENAAQAYAAQTPAFRRNIDRFVQGANAYAAAHPQAIQPRNRAVLPIVPTDLFAHLQTIIEFGFVGRLILRDPSIAIPIDSTAMPTGSNAFALAPSRTVSGRAMLVTNPHLPWSGFYTLFEAHLRLGTRNLYGATLIGLPVLTMAFNDTLGWAHTNNYVDGADLYEVEMLDAGHYRFDGKPRALRQKAQQVRVKTEKGLETRDVALSSTVHGPILWRKGGKAYAYRSTRALYPRLFEQYWRMVTARQIREFRRALGMRQLPMFNVVYADQAGHIMYRWDGLLPARGVGDAAYWAGTVPGDRSTTLWTKTYGEAQRPQIIDPPSGWVQNTNDGPWTSTSPMPLDRRKFPPYITLDDQLMLRSQQLLATLQTLPAQSFDAVKALTFRTHVEMADRLLDDGLRAIDAALAQPQAEGDAARRARLAEARRVLAAWDRTADAGSRGAVLFAAWVQVMKGDIFAEPYDASRPLTSPRGLKYPDHAVSALAAAAEKVAAQYGALDVPWGDVFRLRRGAVDLPASGAPDGFGVIGTIEFSMAPDGRREASGGGSYIAVVEFGDRVRADVLLTYGNASEEGAPHNGDQLALLARKEMRPARLETQAIDAALERREVLAIGTLHQ